MKGTVLITGATSGIGLSIADYYRGKGYDTIEVSRLGKDYKVDLSDQSDVADFILEFNRSGIGGTGRLNVLVNNAGALYLDESTMMANDLYTLLLYTPYMLMTRMATRLVGGHIINIASVSGMKADPDTPMYGAMKAGLISMTKSFARRLAPGIRVNCISPGFIDTNLVGGSPLPQEFIDTIPLGRDAHPDELKEVVHMLDESEYITGANIVIDGGVTA